MALKKSDLRKILNNEDATIDERVSEILDLMHEEVDTIKDERDELRDKLEEAEKKGGSDADKWKDKYEDIKKDFEKYKSDREKNDLKTAKEKALRDLLKDADLSDKGIEKAMKYTSLEEFELDDEGKIKTAKEMLKTLKEEWADYAVESGQKGSDTKGKDGAGTNGGKGSSMTMDEIYAKDEKGRYKLSASERQKALYDNRENL